jgi:hypothetical protein
MITPRQGAACANGQRRDRGWVEDPATNDDQEAAAPNAPRRRNAAQAEVVAVATGEGRPDGMT